VLRNKSHVVCDTWYLSYVTQKHNPISTQVSIPFLNCDMIADRENCFVSCFHMSINLHFIFQSRASIIILCVYSITNFRFDFVTRATVNGITFNFENPRKTFAFLSASFIFFPPHREGFFRKTVEIIHF
jgi:hypothetical protein